MSVVQEIADVLPRPFFARPRAKELDWVAIWLGPATIPLERFVEPPAEVLFLFRFTDEPRCQRRGGTGCVLHRFIPTALPPIEARAVHGVDVGCAPDLVVPEYSRFEKDQNRLPPGGACLD